MARPPEPETSSRRSALSRLAERARDVSDATPADPPSSDSDKAPPLTATPSLALSSVATDAVAPQDGPTPLGVPPWRRRLVILAFVCGLPIVTVAVMLRIPVARGHLVALAWPFLSQAHRELALEPLDNRFSEKVRREHERARLPIYLAVLAEALHAPAAADRPLLSRALVRLRALGDVARPAAPLLVHLLNRRYVRDYGHDIIETLLNVETDAEWIAARLEPVVTESDLATTFAERHDRRGQTQRFLDPFEPRANPGQEPWRRWRRVKVELIPRLAARLESPDPGRSASVLTHYLARDQEHCLFGCGDLWDSHRMLGLDESLLSLGRVDKHLKPFDLKLVSAAAGRRLAALLEGESASDPIRRQAHLLVRCLGYRCDEIVTPALLERLLGTPAGQRGRLITTLGYLGDRAREAGKEPLVAIWQDEDQPMAERFLAVEALARLGLSDRRVLDWLAELPFDRVIFKDMAPDQVQRRVFRAYVRLEANRARREAQAR